MNALRAGIKRFGQPSQARLRGAGVPYFSACSLKRYEPRARGGGPQASGGLFLTLSDWQHRQFSYRKGDLWLLSPAPDFQAGMQALSPCLRQAASFGL